MSKGGNTNVDETPQERELAKVMTEKYGFYKDQIEPLIQEYKSRVTATNGDYSRAEGAASGATTSAFKSARQNVDQSNMRHGIAPTSGAASASATDLASREGSSRAARGVEAANAVTNREYTGLQNVIAMGSGEPAQAQAGFTELAGRSVNNAVYDANLAQARNEARASNYGTAVGLGLRAYQGASAPSQPEHSPTWQDRQKMGNYEYMNTPWGG